MRDLLSSLYIVRITIENKNLTKTDCLYQTLHRQEKIPFGVPSNGKKKLKIL